MSLSGERLEKLNEVLTSEKCKGDPNYCPCVYHYNQRRRYEQEHRDQPEMSYDQYVSRVIMGNDNDE